MPYNKSKSLNSIAIFSINAFNNLSRKSIARICTLKCIFSLHKNYLFRQFCNYSIQFLSTFTYTYSLADDDDAIFVAKLKIQELNEKEKKFKGKL